MTSAVQHRKGTTAEHATFTGLEGEVTIDTTKDTAVIHDGSTVGGFPLAKENLANFSTSGLSSITGSATASDDKFVVYDQSATSLKTITRSEMNSMIQQDSFADISVTGGAIDGTPIGTTTPSTGAFTTITASGTVTVPTPSSSTDAATKGYVDTSISNLIDSAPTALNTLNELAAALGDDANFASTVTTSIATKAPIASPAFTGSVTLSDGTANGVAYLNGSKVLTTGSVLTFDGAQLGVNGVSVGRGAGAVSTNTAVGASALGNASQSGTQSTVIGYQAGYSNTSGANQTFAGYLAGYSNTTGASNSALGDRALAFTTTGSYNTAIGGQALNANTTASNNTAVGYQAGYSNTTARNNALFGWQSGYSLNQTDASESGNQMFGFFSGYGVTSGKYNNFFGYASGYLVTTGSKNTIIGAYSGNQGGLDIRTASNYIVLSDGDGNPQVVIPKNSSGNGYILVGPTKSDPSGASYYNTISAEGADVQLILQRTGSGAGWAGIGASSSAAFLVYGQGLSSTPFRVNQTDGTVILKGGNNSATGTGITFPGTQVASSDANTLDDYEEGYWTPGISLASGSPTYSNQSGSYTKIGNVCYVWGMVSFTATAGETINDLTGLPFNSAGYSGWYPGPPITNFYYIDLGSGGTQLGGYWMNGNNYIRFHCCGNNTGQLSPKTTSSAMQVRFEGMFTV